MRNSDFLSSTGCIEWPVLANQYAMAIYNYLWLYNTYYYVLYLSNFTRPKVEYVSSVVNFYLLFVWILRDAGNIMWR